LFVTCVDFLLLLLVHTTHSLFGCLNMKHRNWD
jgi:hypothetical protein